MKQIYHKKNELFEVEFYEDKECNISFDFTNAKDLYIELFNGDITPLLELSAIVKNCNVYTPFLPKLQYYTLSAISDVLSENKNTLHTLSAMGRFTDGTFYNSILQNIKTITPNLSKYIPQDNAVLFLSEEGLLQNRDKVYPREHWYMQGDILQYITTGSHATTKATIFLPHGTQSKLEKVNEVAKELKEKYGVGEVNLFVLHCFIKYTPFKDNEYYINDNGEYAKYSFDKVITTNSTGILKPQNIERLQVINCKEIFEDYMSNGN